MGTGKQPGSVPHNSQQTIFPQFDSMLFAADWRVKGRSLLKRIGFIYMATTYSIISVGLYSIIPVVPHKAVAEVSE